MRSKLLVLLLICFCGLISAQISSKIKLEKNHQYELYYTADKSSLLILDKTNLTYYFRYVSRGDVLTFITSKGTFQTNNATISLDTFQPDFNYRHYNYQEVQPNYYGNYITPLGENTSNAIEIYFDKDLFFYNGYDVHPKIYTYQNGQKSEISNFEMHQDEKNKKYYLSLEKERFANSKISIIFNTDEFLLDLSKIGFTTFYVNSQQYPVDDYLNMSDWKFSVSSGKLILQKPDNSEMGSNPISFTKNQLEFFKQNKRAIKALH